MFAEFVVRGQLARARGDNLSTHLRRGGKGGRLPSPQGPSWRPAFKGGGLTSSSVVRGRGALRQPSETTYAIVSRQPYKKSPARGGLDGGAQCARASGARIERANQSNRLARDCSDRMERAARSGPRHGGSSSRARRRFPKACGRRRPSISRLRPYPAKRPKKRWR
jgi:hypothetical protein